MNTSLIAELEAIAGDHPTCRPFVERLRNAKPDFEAQAPLVVAAASSARLGAFRTTTLLLKLLIAEHDTDTATRAGTFDRPPWELVEERLRQPLRDAAGHLSDLERKVLSIEEYALRCERLGARQISEIGIHHDAERAVLACALPGEQAQFLRDKLHWLSEEVRLDVLHDVYEQAAHELQSTRNQYLKIVGRAPVDLVKAAHALALARYRAALDDPNLTPEELQQRLQHDLHSEKADNTLVRIEPELRQALLDSEQGIEDDYNLLLDIDRQHLEGRLRPASEEELREAKQVYRELAQLLHTDKLSQRPQYSERSAENEERLTKIWNTSKARFEEIWNLASGTRGGRVYLSRERVLNFLENLRQWKEEVVRILRALSIPLPSLLLHGSTIDELRADLERLTADVARRLQLMHSDIQMLECDPLHGEYRRVIGLSESARSAERHRMEALAAAWNAEARELSAQLLARHCAAGHDGQHGHAVDGTAFKPQEQQP